jgi:hypothetical protein
VCIVESAKGPVGDHREWEVRGVCMAKRSGPRVVWLLGRKRQLTIFFGLESNQKEQLPLILCPKQLSVWWGGSAENVRVLEKIVRWERRERERSGSFGDRGGHRPCPLWNLGPSWP